jgi:hypothetical protein
MSLTKTDVIPLLLEASPAFETVLREYHEDDGPEDEWLPYLDIGEFASYVVQLYADGQTSDFDAIFAALERLIEDGDEDTQGLAIVGVLEGIQNAASWQPFGPSAFVPWLKPKSRTEWDHLDKLWKAAGGSLANVIRLEREAAKRDDGEAAPGKPEN